MSRPSWIGQTLGGRYTIEALLGQGGMSAVYRAQDRNLRRTVALKLIHSHLAGDEEFLRRFEIEATGVAQLRHPNIVQVFDFNHDQDVYFMIMEYLPGESLHARLKKLNAAGERMPVTEAARLLASITDAVAYAHDQGTIHRDIKPANVMLLPNGQPVLTDFGIAKIVGAQQQTATGAVLGTPTYMSPEQVRGERLDGRADIYSLGVMLYEMAAGRPPFESDSAMGIMLKHINEPVPDIRQMVAGVPNSLKEVLDKALSKQPETRFQKASELAASARAIAISPGPATGPGRLDANNATILDTLSPVTGATQLEYRPAQPDSSATQFDRASEGHKPPFPNVPGGSGHSDAAGGRPTPDNAKRPMSPVLIAVGVGGLLLLCLLLAGGVAAALGGPALMGLLGPTQTVPPTAVVAGATDPAPVSPEPATATGTAPGAATSTAPAAATTAVPAPEATPTPVEVAPPGGMVAVPAGTFQMGGGDQADSLPQHSVTLSAFYLDQYEVANVHYLACVESGACTPPLRRSSETRGSYFDNPAFSKYPVLAVTWDQAATFCNWDGKRLPTEAEWEYAATGGDGRRYPWGQAFDPALVPVSHNDTAEIGSFPGGASPFGAFDMAGNVLEWVADWYDAAYYSSSPAQDPTGPDSGARRVLRGGSFGNPDSAIYANTRRFSRPPNGADVDIGFRCALSAP
jgi:eukaryotic-like serine/threonine-protein kinase